MIPFGLSGPNPTMTQANRFLASAFGSADGGASLLDPIVGVLRLHPKLAKKVYRGVDSSGLDLCWATSHPLYFIVTRGCPLKIVREIYDMFPGALAKVFNKDRNVYALHGVAAYKWVTLDVLQFVVERNPGVLVEQSAHWGIPLHLYLRTQQEKADPKMVRILLPENETSLPTVPPTCLRLDKNNNKDNNIWMLQVQVALHFSAPKPVVQLFLEKATANHQTCCLSLLRHHNPGESENLCPITEQLAVTLQPIASKLRELQMAWKQEDRAGNMAIMTLLGEPQCRALHKLSLYLEQDGMKQEADWEALTASLEDLLTRSTTLRELELHGVSMWELPNYQCSLLTVLGQNGTRLKSLTLDFHHWTPVKEVETLCEALQTNTSISSITLGQTKPTAALLLPVQKLLEEHNNTTLTKFEWDEPKQQEHRPVEDSRFLFIPMYLRQQRQQRERQQQRTPRQMTEEKRREHFELQKMDEVLHRVRYFLRANNLGRGRMKDPFLTKEELVECLDMIHHTGTISDHVCFDPDLRFDFLSDAVGVWGR